MEGTSRLSSDADDVFLGRVWPNIGDTLFLSNQPPLLDSSFAIAVDGSAAQ